MIPLRLFPLWLQGTYCTGMLNFSSSTDKLELRMTIDKLVPRVFLDSFYNPTYGGNTYWTEHPKSPRIYFGPYRDRIAIYVFTYGEPLYPIKSIYSHHPNLVFEHIE